MKRIMLVPLALGLALAGPAALAGTARPPAQPQPQASIPFANHGGVYNWVVENDRTVWFEDNHHHWYRATLMGNAIDLPFVEAIGIDTRPGGALDRWGAIIVKGQRYVFSSFEAMPGPPPKLARHHKTTPPAKKPD